MTLEPDAARPARRRFSALLTTDGALDLAERAGVLQRDPAYQAYAARVRYRLLPGAF
jgi:hypothetical protein